MQRPFPHPTPKTTLLFPGQGAYYGGALAPLFAHSPEIQQTFDQIDAVAQRHLGRKVSDTITQPNPPGLTELLAHAPELLPLAIYGVSVATYRIWEVQGLKPDLLLGHSFGEIAALVCAGAFTVAEGAEIVCLRGEALKALGSVEGHMAAVGADAARVESLLALIQDPALGIAAENSPTQTVVSGPDTSMAVLSELAAVLKIPVVRLASAYPFHSALLAPAVADLRARLSHLRARPLEIPVFSPILGRAYQTGDVLTDCLAQHLVQPVRFAEAVCQVRTGGGQVFVECGALDTLGKLVRGVLPSPEITTVSCLTPRLGDQASLTAAGETLRALGLLPPVAPCAPLLPGVDVVAWNAFWAAHGPAFLGELQRAFARFDKPETTPLPVSAPAGLTREELARELIALYAAALEYPEEVFTDTVEMEAELGIDSVKQTELLTRVSARYNLPPRPADFRLSDYDTMGKITDFVYESRGARP